MSLTILFQTPVDTGTANVSKEWDNPNLKDFYLLTGNCTPVELRLQVYPEFVERLRSGVRFSYIFSLPPSPSPFEAGAAL